MSKDEYFPWPSTDIKPMDKNTDTLFRRLTNLQPDQLAAFLDALKDWREVDGTPWEML